MGASAVFGAHSEPSPAGTAPPGELVYVPAQRFSPGTDELSPETRHLDDGRQALLIYSTLELLMAGCGKAQPWVAIRLAGPDALARLARLARADVVLRDVEVPAEVRRTGGKNTGGKDVRP
ncbi:MAG: SAV_915 family protein [Actinomadura sp.]